MIDIAITWNLRTDWRARRLIERAARHALTAEGFHRGSLSIAVVGRRAMRTLHRRTLSIDAATDVLTFDLLEDDELGIADCAGAKVTLPAGRRIDAEIVVCADVARRRMRTLKAATAELCLYVVHGILHLAGHDDHDPPAFARMHAREDELLSEIGLGRVFGSGAR